MDRKKAQGDAKQPHGYDVLLQVDAKNIFYNFGLTKLDEISISKNFKNI